MKKKSLILLCLLINTVIFSQNGASNCSSTEPMCSDNEGVKIFENTTGVPNESSMGCLGSTPNPTWFHIKAGSTGDLSFQIIQSSSFDENGNANGTSFDVDFIAWGPFDSPNADCNNLASECVDESGNLTFCPNNSNSPSYYLNNLDNTNIIDCSYSFSSVENFTINNAQANEYYILLITNFDGEPGSIKLEQTNFGQAGAGTTDCSIIAGELGLDQNVCQGTTVTLDGTPTFGTATSHSWELDTGSGFNVISGENNPTLEISNNVSGTYKVVITDQMNDEIEDEVVISFLPIPEANTVEDLIFVDPDQDGINTFDLQSEFTSEILGTQDPDQFSVIYYDNLTDAENNNTANALLDMYTNTTPYFSQDIYARIHNTIEPNACFDITQFNISISQIPIPLQPADINACDDEVSGSDIDGFFNNFILSTKDQEILGDLSPSFFNVSYHTTLTGAQTNSLTDVINKNTAYTNTIPNEQTIYVRVENINDTTVFVVSEESSMTFKPFSLIVNPLPTINSFMQLTLCETSQTIDIDLTLQEENISTNFNNEIFKYFNTESDAINEISEITMPSNYTISNGATIWVKVISDNNCSRIAEINFNISLIPAPTQANDYNICLDLSNGGNTAGYYNDFLLATKDDEILGNLDAAQFNISYHTTSIGAQTDNSTDLIDKDATYRNTTINEQEIYVRIENIDNTECYIVSEENSETFKPFSLIVTPLPTINSFSQASFCTSNTNLTLDMDLTLQEGNISTNYNNETFKYYNTENDAINESSEITTPSNYTISNGDRIWVKVFSDNNCYRIAEINFNISLIPEPTQASDYIVCDDISNGGDTDGFFNDFLLSSKDDEILGNLDATQFNISYHTTSIGAQTDNITDVINKDSSYRNTIINEQEIYVRIENIDNTECYIVSEESSNTFKPFSLIVNSLPTVNSATQLIQCDSNNDLTSLMDLTLSEINISDNYTTETFKYFLTENDAINETSEITSSSNHTVTNGDTIWVKVINDNNCYRLSELNIIVSFDPSTLNNIPSFIQCDDEFDNEGNNSDEDGITNFDLSSLTTSVLSNFPIAVQDDLDVLVFETIEDRDLQINSINDLSTYRNSNLPALTTQNLYIKIVNTTNNSCSGIEAFTFETTPLPNFEVTTPQIFCSEDGGLTVEAENPNGVYTYEWEKGNELIINENSSSLDISSAGDYTVTATNTSNCSRVKTITVIESEIAILNENFITIVDDSNNNSITIQEELLGSGDYEYALLNADESDILVNYQDDPLFDNLEGGVYTIAVRDKNNCGEATYPISILEFPKFITPNNDGHNDTWQIIGLTTDFYPKSSILIFDRYGKNIAEINSEDGWDGTYNGQLLPANDYWYKVELTDNEGNTRIKKSHFSLIIK